MSQTIRAAQPTATEASAFADLSNLASGNLQQQLIGRRTQHVLSEMFKQPGNLHTYDNAQFALVNGAIAGMLCAYSAERKHEQDGPTNTLYMRSMGLALPRLLWGIFSLRPLINFLDQTSPQSYYVLYLAVYPQYQGRGLGKALLARAEENARAAAARTLELDVDINNTVALNAYQKHGMTIAASSPTIRHEGKRIGLYRMVKHLKA